MKQFKIIVDRKKVSKATIESKQNFESVLAQVKLTKSPFWKSTWFFGTVGISSVALVIGYTMLQNQNKSNEEIITQENTTTNKITFAVNTTQEIEKLTSVATSTEVSKIEEAVKEVKTNVQSIPVKKPKGEELAELKPSNAVVEPEIAEAKTTKPVHSVLNTLPSIDGVYNGDISFERFKTGEITVGNDLNVTQYSIQFTSRVGDKTISVQGAKIPNEVIEELDNIGLSQTIFITNVIAKNENDELLRCNSLDLKVKF